MKKQKKASTKRKLSKQGRTVVLYMLIAFWIFSIFTLFSIGPIGRFLNHTMQLLVGWLGYFLVPLSCLLGFAYLWNGGRFPLSKKTMWATLCFSLCISLLFGLSQMQVGQPWSALAAWQASLSQFFSNSYASLGGLLGTALAGALASVLTSFGAWLVAAVLLIAGLVLLIDILTQNEVAEKRSIKDRLIEAQEILALPMPDLSKIPEMTKTELSKILPLPQPQEENTDQTDTPIHEDLLDQTLLEQNEETQEGEEYEEASEESQYSSQDPYPTESIDLSEDLELQEVQDGFKPSLTSKFMDFNDESLQFEVEKSEEYPDQAPFQEARKFVNEFHQPKNTLQHSLFETHSHTEMYDNFEMQESPYEKEELDFISQRESFIETDLKDSDFEDFSQYNSLSFTNDLDPVLGRSLLEKSLGSPQVLNSKKVRLEGWDGYEGSSLRPAPPYNPQTYTLPSLSLLKEPKPFLHSSTNLRVARKQGKRLVEVFQSADVEVELTAIHIGPSVTQFEIVASAGESLGPFFNLQNEIKEALQVSELRCSSPMDRQDVFLFEVANLYPDFVGLKEMLQQVPAVLQDKPLVFPIGKDVMSNNIYGRLDTMPHLLIVGKPGSGRLQGIHALLCSFLMRTTPDEVKLLLIDPTKEELAVYSEVPHLLGPMISEPLMASSALKQVIAIMEERIALFSQVGVRNLSAYNAQNAHHLPRIVVVINELADLMACASKEVEHNIERITLEARAAGIHLVVSTVQPSVNVVTGVVKKNIPSRMTYALNSRIDSRIALEHSGAELLMGQGDMLFEDGLNNDLTRIQGIGVDQKEVEAICQAVSSQASPIFDEVFLQLKTEGKQKSEQSDPLYGQIKEFVIAGQRASASLIQRHFRLSPARASRILDQLEESGVVGPANGSRPRKILIPPRRTNKHSKKEA